MLLISGKVASVNFTSLMKTCNKQYLTTCLNYNESIIMYHYRTNLIQNKFAPSVKEILLESFSKGTLFCKVV